jgi:type IV pilus assembly protein PilB
MSEDLQKKLDELRREAEERDAQKRSRQLGFPYIDLRRIPVSSEAIGLIPEEKARQIKAVAIQKKLNVIIVVFYNPKTKEAEELINELKSQNFEIKIFISSESGIKEAWDAYKFVPPPKEEITGEIKITKSTSEKLTSEINNLASLQNKFKAINFDAISTTDLFQLILTGALINHSSDIHFEAQKNAARLRFRIDGVLYDVFQDIPLKNYEGLVSRIKLLSGLKINVHEEAQDKRFTINLGDEEIEVRVSIIPSEFGETIVMRILDPKALIVGLEELGLRSDDFKIFEKAIKRPNGLILNTGPTGSGKTTTLYAILRALNTPKIKIITIEDPIEYRIEGIEQTQVNPDAGYTFASGLRAIVRQDPDIVLVGEIRDQETAEIALQAALTGHLVLSTLHTNDAIGAIPRLVDLGVKPQTIAPALSLAIAQRLVRKLCNNCKKEVEINEELKSKIEKFIENLPKRVNKEEYKNFKIYESVGCEKCNNIGYKGRIAIFEFFEGGTDVEQLILKEISWSTLKELAYKKQMTTMQEDGVLKVLSGITTFEEIEDETGPIEWMD